MGKPNLGNRNEDDGPASVVRAAIVGVGVEQAGNRQADRVGAADPGAIDIGVGEERETSLLAQPGCFSCDPGEVHGDRRVCPGPAPGPPCLGERPDDLRRQDDVALEPKLAGVLVEDPIPVTDEVGERKLAIERSQDMVIEDGDEPCVGGRAASSSPVGLPRTRLRQFATDSGYGPTVSSHRDVAA